MRKKEKNGTTHTLSLYWNGICKNPNKSDEISLKNRQKHMTIDKNRISKQLWFTFYISEAYFVLKSKK